LCHGAVRPWFDKRHKLILHLVGKTSQLTLKKRYERMFAGCPGFVTRSSTAKPARTRALSQFPRLAHNSPRPLFFAISGATASPTHPLHGSFSNSSQHGEPRGLSVPGRAADTSPSSSPIPRGAHGIQLARGTKDLHRRLAQRPRPPQCSKSEALKGLSSRDRTDICPSSSSRVPGAGSRTRSIQGLFPRSSLRQTSMALPWREEE